MRQADAVYYLHGDHLGSTSLTTCGSECGSKPDGSPIAVGEVVSEVRYHPYGQERWANGVAVTDFGFVRPEDGMKRTEHSVRKIY